MKLKKIVEDRVRHLEKLNGYITPEIIVADAQDPDSPLHGEFCWDKTEAAHKYWLHQARKIISSVQITIITESKTVSTVAYTRDPTRPGNEQGYISVEKARNDEEISREILIDEFKRAGAALQRAQRLAIAFNMENEVDAMARKVNKLRKNVEEYSLHS